MSRPHVSREQVGKWTDIGSQLAGVAMIMYGSVHGFVGADTASPHQDANRQVYACADKLDVAPMTVPVSELSKPCGSLLERYTTENIALFTGEANMPSQRDFIQQNVQGSAYDAMKTDQRRDAGLWGMGGGVGLLVGRKIVKGFVQGYRQTPVTAADSITPQLDDFRAEIDAWDGTIPEQKRSEDE